MYAMPQPMLKRTVGRFDHAAWLSVRMGVAAPFNTAGKREDYT
jgi:hypothetical protein